MFGSGEWAAVQGERWCYGLGLLAIMAHASVMTVKLCDRVRAFGEVLDTSCANYYVTGEWDEGALRLVSGESCRRGLGSGRFNPRSSGTSDGLRAQHQLPAYKMPRASPCSRQQSVLLARL